MSLSAEEDSQTEVMAMQRGIAGSKQFFCKKKTGRDSVSS